jgi:hypothetical protein
MKVDQKGHNYKDTQGDFLLFLMKVTHQYKTEKQNIIIDLLHHKDLTLDDVNYSCLCLNNIKKSKKIFIIVISDLDYNAV